jgi:hypothetical protein
MEHQQTEQKRSLTSEKPKQLVSKNKGISLQDNRVHHTIQKKANNTGLPNQLKSGIESLSGHSMDDVKVHYNSSKPAQLNAHAYAQGTDIHVASGQEKHLPHEAWHVVQQKQGRVRPTMQLKAKVNINDDKSLEKEADVMGARALIQRVDNKSVPQRQFFTNNQSVQLAKSTKKDKVYNKHIKDTQGILDKPIRKRGVKLSKAARKKTTTKQQNTEAIGERGTALAFKKKFPSAVMLTGFSPGVGIDQVWQDKTHVYVVEAKGPGAKLGFVDGIGYGVKQMSLPWVESRAAFEEVSIKKAIQDAIKNNKLKRIVGYGYKSGNGARLDDISNQE